MTVATEDPDDAGRGRSEAPRVDSVATQSPPDAYIRVESAAADNRLKSPRSRRVSFWVKLGLSAVCIAMAARSLLYADGHPLFRAGFTWLILPIAIGLEAASTRRYHQYRSGLQAMIQGRIDKQREAAEKAKKKDPAKKPAPPAEPGVETVALTMFDIAGNRDAPSDMAGTVERDIQGS
ncbi:MAG: hypothetical protein ABI702_20235 [Burkholderiales bacterium]